MTRGWALPHPRAPTLFDLRLAVIGSAVATAAGYVLATRSTTVAAALCLLPAVALLVASPGPALSVLGAALPFTISLSGGSGGLEVSPSDLLLTLISGAILAPAVMTHSFPSLQAIRPVALPLALYGGFMVVLLAAHPGTSAVIQSLQRLELFLIPAVVGAFVVQRGKLEHVLRGYVLVTTLLAVVWQFDDLGMQKNPTGQFMASAILLILGVPSLRRFAPCLVVLVPGLLLTESRGSVLAAVLGVAVLLVWRRSDLRWLLGRLVPIAAIAAIAFFFMPASTQERLTTLRGGTDSRAAYAIKIREDFAADADVLISAQPFTGYGVGNYYDASVNADLKPIEDPHQVLLLQAVEGGYAFPALFVLMIAITGFVLFRFRRIPLAGATAAIVISTAAHGIVDVYWVRGTPVLSWILVGAVCALAASRAREPA